MATKAIPKLSNFKKSFARGCSTVSTIVSNIAKSRQKITLNDNSSGCRMDNSLQNSCVTFNTVDEKSSLASIVWKSGSWTLYFILLSSFYYFLGVKILGIFMHRSEFQISSRSHPYLSIRMKDEIFCQIIYLI